MAEAKTKREISSEELSQLVVKGMQEKKANNIVIMDLRKVKNAFTDFFVVCSGNSDTQVDAIAESVDKEVWEETRNNPRSMEGKANHEWILVDYYDVIVHVFKKDRREFYKLEELWGDAEFTYLSEDDN